MWVQEHHHRKKPGQCEEQQRLSSMGSKILLFPPSFLPLPYSVPLSQ